MSGPCLKLALTCGDPAGVGPRAILAAVRQGALPKSVSPLYVGESSVWQAAGWRRSDGPIRCTHLGVSRLPRMGRPSIAGGRISAAAFEESLRLCARGIVGGIVTAPISKESWASCGYAWRDHTERLSQCAPHGRAQMVLGVPSKRIWCAIATRHIPLGTVARSLNSALVMQTASALNAALVRLGYSRPRLALCGLNPHAGESELLGSEEARILRPAVRRLNHDGVHVVGPLPADSAWRLHALGQYDGLICQYHDQALIPLKVLGGLSGVNWTLGIPFVRTSPAHGTAFDAARGNFDASATIEALRLAGHLLSRT